jgi:hypothetical protein
MPVAGPGRTKPNAASTTSSENQSPVLVPGFSDCGQSLPDLIVISFQWSMDSGSALRPE